jgi:hypothetical protein
MLRRRTARRPYWLWKTCGGLRDHDQHVRPSEADEYPQVWCANRRRVTASTCRRGRAATAPSAVLVIGSAASSRGTVAAWNHKCYPRRSFCTGDVPFTLEEGRSYRRLRAALAAGPATIRNPESVSGLPLLQSTSTGSAGTPVLPSTITRLAPSGAKWRLPHARSDKITGWKSRPHLVNTYS